MRTKRDLSKLIIEKKHRPRGKRKYDVQMYLVDRERIWSGILKRLWNRYKAIKFEIRLETKLQKRQKENDYIYCSPCFRSKSRVVLTENTVEEIIQEAMAQILDAYDVYMKEGSGWLLHNVEFSQINIYRYETRGGSGGRKAKDFREALLPSKYVKNYRSVITFPPAPGNKCFLHCILAALHPLTKEKSRRKKLQISEYLKHEHELNTRNLKYPVTLQQIPQFEMDNNLCINVVGVDKKQKTFFLYKSRQENKPRINLLLHKRHYSLIQSWNCFLNYCSRDKRTLCQKCGKYNIRRTTTQQRCSFCEKGELQTRFDDIPDLHFPKHGTRQKFINFKNTKDHPFVFYCDLETMLKPVMEEEEEQKRKRKTKKKKIHRPISIGYLRVCTNKKFSHKKPVIHTGEDCIEKFYSSMKKEIEYMDDILATVNYPLDMSKEQEREHDGADSCWVCDVALKDEEKLRDHDHLKKFCNYLGTVCNACNLNRTDTERNQTPLIFHAGSRFDINFLIEKIHILKQTETRIIGKSGENIMSMNLFKKRLVVIDSLNHLSSSLAALVEILKKSGKPLKYTRRSLDKDEEGLELVSRKGVFPYEYVTSLERLKETTALPSAKEFYDELKEKSIAEDDYQHALKVWEHFNCKTLQDYMEIYLSSDITLLADVFENYRKFFREKFVLDSAKYLSLPGLSYDCMLKYTKCKLDFIYNKETYDFLRRGLRGGVSMITHRFEESNHPQLDSYDPNKPTTHLIYLDANALYSSIMTRKLPYRGLKWKNFEKNEMKRIIEEYTDQDKIGYFVECDLSYPPEIHDMTKDLPLAPEHRLVTEDMLSPYARSLKEKLGIKTDKVPKLLSTQYAREKYVCHIENLQFYLRKGMRLTKVHKVLEFRQKNIMKDYIDLCIRERNKTGISADEKSMWKLCCNAIFGKSIQNVEKRNSMTLLTDEKKVLRAISNPRFKHADLINKKIVQVCSFKRKNMVTTPYYIGVAVLELSKLHMMKIHYDHFMQNFGRLDLTLCMTDTDSLLYSIRGEEVEKRLKEMEIIEFGNYPEDHPYHEQEQTGKLFYLKDESAGKPIKSFVGLRAKNYSIEYENEKDNKTVGKGVPRAKLEKITHEDLKRVLGENTTVEISSNQLRSYKHKMYSIQQDKIALSPLDNKRYLCKDGIHTLPYGHIDALGEEENEDE